MDQYEIRLARTSSPRRDDRSLLVAADVIAQLGREAPEWSELTVHRLPAPSLPAEDGDISVTGSLMDRPLGPAPLDPSWEILLFHICAIPDPDRVEQWLHRSREITDGMPLAALAWFELDDTTTNATGWGEVHLTAARDTRAVADLLAHPLWSPSQPLLDAAVAPHHQLVTRPTLNRLPPFG